MPGYIACRGYPMVYLNVPKAACTTIKNYIYFFDHGEYYPTPLDLWRHADNYLLTFNNGRSAIRDKLRSSITFTFVRHPVRRAYSLFNEKILHQGRYSFPRVRKILIDQYRADFSELRDPKQVGDNFVKFLHFVNDIIRGKFVYRKDHHWIPQSSILINSYRFRMLDFIGRVEHFDRDFQYILDHIGYQGQFDFKRFNESPSGSLTYEDIANENIRELGYKIYSRDFENFAYQTE